MRRKGNPLTLLVRNVNWCSHYKNQYWSSSKKLKIELPYDPAVPFLAIYPDKTVIWQDIRTPMFIAALFTIAKTWKHWEFGFSRCKLVYIGRINNKVLLYSIWNYIQYPVINHNENIWKRLYTYNWLTLLYSRT